MRWRSGLQVVLASTVTTAAILALAVPGALGQSATDDPAQLEAGQAVFEANCAGCHGADGAGTQRGRPLIGIAEAEPDRLVHIASVTNGKGNMPAWGDSLDAAEIDAAVSYVRLTFVDAAAQTDAAEAEELAVTGVDSAVLAFVGVGLIGFGLVLRYLRPRRADGFG